MGKFKDFLNESKSDYKLYHDTFTSAFDEMKKFVSKNGYEMNQNDVDREITHGGASGRARPSSGETKRFTIELHSKSGKTAKRFLQAQVYDRGQSRNTFELNMYIS